MFIKLSLENVLKKSVEEYRKKLRRWFSEEITGAVHDGTLREFLKKFLEVAPKESLEEGLSKLICLYDQTQSGVICEEL